ncbi:hypothetical protein ACJX0J_006635, partial [Zea mays]
MITFYIFFDYFFFSKDVGVRLHLKIHKFSLYMYPHLVILSDKLLTINFGGFFGMLICWIKQASLALIL